MEFQASETYDGLRKKLPRNEIEAATTSALDVVEEDTALNFRYGEGSLGSKVILHHGWCCCSQPMTSAGIGRIVQNSNKPLSWIVGGRTKPYCIVISSHGYNGLAHAQR